MALNIDRIKKALEEFRKNPETKHQEGPDDWNDEWFYGFQCDPWEVWDGEADEIERNEIASSNRSAGMDERTMEKGESSSTSDTGRSS